MSLLRSRQPASDTSGTNLPPNHRGDPFDEEADKGNAKSFLERNKAQIVIFLGVPLWCCIFLAIKTHGVRTKRDVASRRYGPGEVRDAKPKVIELQRAPMGSIIYGAKSKGGNTAKLVKEAIQSGFRHIATVRCTAKLLVIICK